MGEAVHTRREGFIKPYRFCSGHFTTNGSFVAPGLKDWFAARALKGQPSDCHHRHRSMEARLSQCNP